jgi:DNA-binding MarR family transcriptional regulator
VPDSDVTADQSAPATHWEGNVLALVHRLSSGIARMFTRRLRREHGVSVPEWRTMMLVAERPGTTAVDIATIFAMDKMAVTRAVQRLMRTGLVERRQRSEDKRSFSLYLTPRGSELYGELLPSSNERYHELVDVLSQDERRQLGELLGRLVKRVDELDP